jgi:uncharacterized protein (DUF2249 family)
MPGFLLEAGQRVKVFNPHDPEALSKRRNQVLPGNWECAFPASREHGR